MHTPVTLRAIDLDEAFATDADAARRILTAVSRSLATPLTAEQILQAADLTHSPMTGLVVLARLTVLGLLSHPGPGLYGPTASGLATIARTP